MSHLPNYLQVALAAEQQLADGFDRTAEHHGDEPDVAQTCLLFASECAALEQRLEPAVHRHAHGANPQPERLHQRLYSGPRGGGLGLLRDLHDLYLLATECVLAWTVTDQAALALRDRELHDLAAKALADHRRQADWIMARVKQEAPQALIAAID